MTAEELIAAIEDEWMGASDAEGVHLLQFVRDFIADATDDNERKGLALSAALMLKTYADSLAIVIRRLQ